MTTKSSIYGGGEPWDLPAYTIPLAARLVRIPTVTLRSWVLGRTYETASQGKKRAMPLIDPPPGGFLSFTNLVEAHVLASMRRVHEIKLHKCRRAIHFMKTNLKVEHPLARETFRTDGVDLFVDKLGTLINVSSDGQVELREAIEQGLTRVFYADGVACQLFPLTRQAEGPEQPRHIVIDPRLAFGRPVLAGTAIPVEEIAQRFQAGDSIDTLAREFGVATDLVSEALRVKILEAA
jgi:uncharacterized protein (DUF433 family)